jgi:hypothetical protein
MIYHIYPDVPNQTSSVLNGWFPQTVSSIPQRSPHPSGWQVPDPWGLLGPQWHVTLRVRWAPLGSVGSRWKIKQLIHQANRGAANQPVSTSFSFCSVYDLLVTQWDFIVTSWDINGIYPLVNKQKNNWKWSFSSLIYPARKWWFSIVFCKRLPEGTYLDISGHHLVWLCSVYKPRIAGHLSTCLFWLIEPLCLSIDP